MEMYSEGLDYDLGERELGSALTFDHELDNLSASLALISSYISDIMKDEGELSSAIPSALVRQVILIHVSSRCNCRV